ncbi:hypothetical protein AOR10_23755 [Vibrio alginolyticus]|nr:hypothetical protein AOR10_23755 [Vibrio alginolyticus]
MAVGFLFNWLKVALGFLANQHFGLAVASAIQHCFALWLERKGACWSFVGLPHWEGKWNYWFWVSRFWRPSWFLPCGLVQKAGMKSQFFLN